MNNEFREFPLLVDSAIGKQIEKKMNSSVDSTVISGHDKIQFILRSVHCPLSSFHVVELRLISRDYFASTHMLRELKILSSVHFWIGICKNSILISYFRFTNILLSIMVRTEALPILRMLNVAESNRKR